MFEDTILALQQMEGRMSVSVTLSDDEDGYFDRECPSEGCLFNFKIHSQDWKDKVRDDEVFCPFCGHTADSGKWWTPEQVEHAQQVAFAHVESTLGGALERDADRWNQRQRRNSLLPIAMKVKSSPQPVLLPSAAAEPMRLKIQCPACACRYAVIGAAYFCPACGTNAAAQVFAFTIAGIRKLLDTLDAIRAAVSDRDAAENTARLIVESGLQNAVTAFQRCAEALYASLPSAARARRNAFQNLVEGSQLWQAAGGSAYVGYLTEEELRHLTCAFQQRHLLAHTQGIVDSDYVTKTADTRYRPGQRIVVKADTVRDAVDLIEKLIAGLHADQLRLGS